MRRVGAASAAAGALTFTQGLTQTGSTVTSDLITGKAGGQEIVGGTVAGDGLTIAANLPGLTGPINFEMGSVFFGLVDATIASAAAATLDLFRVPGPNVTITGATPITTATGFNLNRFDPPTIVSAVAIGAGSATPAAATMVITGVPTISGGGAFAGTTGAVGLWIQGGAATSAVFDGNVIINGATTSITGPNGLQITGNNGILLSVGSNTVGLTTTGMVFNHTGGGNAVFGFDTISTTVDYAFRGSSNEAFRIKGTNGTLQLGATTIAANGTGAGLAFGSLAPAGAHVNPQEWLTVLGTGGAQRWIPMF